MNFGLRGRDCREELGERDRKVAGGTLFAARKPLFLGLWGWLVPSGEKGPDQRWWLSHVRGTSVGRRKG